MVPPGGIEPPTRGLGNRCSSPLSYEGRGKHASRGLARLAARRDHGGTRHSTCRRSPSRKARLSDSEAARRCTPLRVPDDLVAESRKQHRPACDHQKRRDQVEHVFGRGVHREHIAQVRRGHPTPRELAARDHERCLPHPGAGRADGITASDPLRECLRRGVTREFPVPRTAGARASGVEPRPGRLVPPRSRRRLHPCIFHRSFRVFGRPSDQQQRPRCPWRSRHVPA